MLQFKYRLAYQRMDALYIKRTRLGNKSYVLPGDLLLLDELHVHLSAGGKTEEFVSACIEAGSIEMPMAPLTANESALVQSSNETEIAQAEVDNYSGTLEVEIESNYSREDLIGEMVEERAQWVGAEDAAKLDKLDKRSQQRAFAIAAAEETLTTAYRATENFTIPRMKEKLERHRRACDQAMDSYRVHTSQIKLGRRIFSRNKLWITPS